MCFILIFWCNPFVIFEAFYHMFLWQSIGCLKIDAMGQVIDIMTFISYRLQYYSFWKGKIVFWEDCSCFLGNANSHQALYWLLLKTDVFLGCASARNLWRKSLMKYGLWPEIIYHSGWLQIKSLTKILTENALDFLALGEDFIMDRIGDARNLN